MSDPRPQFDQTDVTGRTIHVNGPFGTTPTPLPASPVSGEFLAEILINTQEMVGAADRLLVSFDSGTTYMQLKRNTIVGWFVRGKITQLYVKALSGSVAAELVINLEEE